MKLWFCILLGCSLCLVGSAADEPGTNAAPAVPAAPATSPSPEMLGPYVDLLKREMEFSTAARLFKEMAEVHTQRGQNTSSATEAERARWETELGAEFSRQSAEMLKQLEQVNQQRLAFELKNKVAGTPQFVLGALAGPPGLNIDEITYLTRLDGRIANLDQEIAAVIESGKALTSSLQTNRESEDLLRITDLLQQNSAQSRILEARRSDLELKKLEFRALRRK